MKVTLIPDEAMTVHRRILRKDKLVYLLVAPKPQKYPEGKSSIVYIGTTKKGAKRIATSAAHRAEEILQLWGIKYMNVHVVACSAVQGLRTWVHLEKALIAEFRSNYFRIPLCNKKGKKYRWDDRLDKLFRRKTIHKILMKFDKDATA